MRLSIGFSPCPNDTFIFDALINQKINTGEFSFDLVMAEVETLNTWALEGKLDITKLSLPAYFRSMNHYHLLKSGSALGKSVGPLLIANQEISLEQFTFQKTTVAVPGLNTTANLLLDFALPGIEHKIFLRYDEIENYLLTESLNPKFGVLIHENRFTYQQKGFFKVLDLGDYWETKMNVPIPLGSIAIKKSIPVQVAERIETLIQNSLQYAWQHYPYLSKFVKENSQEMEEDIMRKHIQLYVNEYSMDIGDQGRIAIDKLYATFQKNSLNNKPDSSSSLFSNS